MANFSVRCLSKGLCLTGLLAGHSAVVTGAGSGIGRGIATVLCMEGARVAVTDVDAHRAAAVASELGGDVFSVEMDVTDSPSIERALTRVAKKMDSIDLLVNNAAIPGNPHADIVDQSEQDWDETFDVNVKGAVRTSGFFIPQMREKGSGCIVNIASVAAHAARGSISPYAVSKAALLRYTTGLATALAPKGIRVNAVCPGAVWTPFQEVNIEAYIAAGGPTMRGTTKEVFEDRYRGLIPLGRTQTPEELGYAVAFLGSDRASSITGQCLHVDGGMIMRD